MEESSEKPKHPGSENLKPIKPGECRNPNGRPKGRKNLSTILREMLDEEINVVIEGKTEKRSFQDVIIRKLIKKANDGDIRAIREIFDRVDGKPTMVVEIDQTDARKAISDLFPLQDSQEND